MTAGIQHNYSASYLIFQHQSFFVFCHHPPQSGCFFQDGQAQTASDFLVDQRAFRAGKRGEDDLLKLLRNAVAVIRHDKADIFDRRRRGSLIGDFKIDLAVQLGIFDRIGKQVDQNLVEAHFVAHIQLVIQLVI